MPKAQIAFSTDGDQDAVIYCPGCKTTHAIKIKSKIYTPWSFNNNLMSPTFQPSVRITYRTEPLDQCHFIITNGIINFMADSTHALAGQEVELPNI